MTKTRKTQFLHKLECAYEKAGIDNSKPYEVDYPEFRGLTFEDFWYKLNEKLGVDIPFLDYERELAQDLEETLHEWIKKCAGIGITECILRWITWKCVKDDEWKCKHIDIDVILITGPRLDLAITIMRRLKALFPELPKTKETLMIINGVYISAFPSHHVASAHGLNPIVVLMEEGDLFPVNQQYEAREVAERYIPKTNPWILWISTPYLPGGLFEQIEKEKKCMYRRKFFLVDRALKDGRFTAEQVKKWSESPSFMREAWGEYGYGLGDIFKNFDDIIEKYGIGYMGGRSGTYADPAFGSSKFGIISAEVRDGIIYITEAEEFERETPVTMLDVMSESWGKHNQACKVDASNPGFIKALTERNIPAIPVSFSELVPETEGSNTTVTLKKKLPINASEMVKKKLVRIHPDFKALISQMRAVTFDKKGGIDKSEVPFDLVDAFNMCLWDLKSHDYSFIGITHDGKLMKEKPKEKKSTGLIINKVEYN